MRLADEIHEALKEYDRLSYRTGVASKALAFAWAAQRDLHKSNVLDPLLGHPQAKQALMWLKLSGKLPDPSEYANIELYLWNLQSK